LVTDPHGQGGELIEPHTVVPVSAVQRDGREQVVFVAIGDHRFERREVVTGRKADGAVEILEGVEPGEQVVVEGAFVLKSEAAKGNIGEGHSH
jgi:cobalt-zinc-cadmium efflux system membrane fusion protein